MPGTRRGRPNDPGRRDRIVSACLDVIAEAGVAGTSHRRVAARAGVPLGSVTYHFAGMAELLAEAFGAFAFEVSARFDRALAAEATARPLREALSVVVGAEVLTDRRDVVLTLELYTLAAREPAFRGVTDDWMARTRATLERYLDPATARLVDALIEGATVHAALARAGTTGPEADARATLDAALARLLPDRSTAPPAPPAPPAR